jgi:PilZ domain
MSNEIRFPENSNSGTNPELGNGSAVSQESVNAKAAGKARTSRYSDIQNATRFPIKLPIAVKSKSGDSCTETENISANGVLFQMDSDMPIGSLVDFTISLPAEVVGAAADVRVDCRGRVVRSSEDGGRRGVGVVIDEYRFDRR